MPDQSVAADDLIVGLGESNELICCAEVERILACWSSTSERRSILGVS